MMTSRMTAELMLRMNGMGAGMRSTESAFWILVGSLTDALWAAGFFLLCCYVWYPSGPAFPTWLFCGVCLSTLASKNLKVSRGVCLLSSSYGVDISCAPWLNEVLSVVDGIRQVPPALSSVGLVSNLQGISMIPSRIWSSIPIRVRVLLLGSLGWLQWMAWPILIIPWIQVGFVRWSGILSLFLLLNDLLPN